MDEIKSINFNTAISTDLKVNVDVDKSIKQISDSFAKIEKTYVDYLKVAFDTSEFIELLKEPFEELSKILAKSIQNSIQQLDLNKILQAFKESYADQISEISNSVDFSKTYERLFNILNDCVENIEEEINHSDLSDDIKVSYIEYVEDTNNQIDKLCQENKIDINKISLIISILFFVIGFIQSQINSNSSQETLDRIDEKVDISIEQNEKYLQNQSMIIELLSEIAEHTDTNDTPIHSSD